MPRPVAIAVDVRTEEMEQSHSDNEKRTTSFVVRSVWSEMKWFYSSLLQYSARAMQPCLGHWPTSHKLNNTANSKDVFFRLDSSRANDCACPVVSKQASWKRCCGLQGHVWLASPVSQALRLICSHPQSLVQGTLSIMCAWLYIYTQTTKNISHTRRAWLTINQSSAHYIPRCKHQQI